MRNSTKVLFSMALALGFSIGSAAEKQNFKVVKLQNVKAQGASWVTSSNRQAFFCTNLIKIDTTKKYTLSAKVRTIGGTDKSQVYLGFAPFTAKRQELRSANCNGFANSLTTLTKPAKKGDQVLQVKNGANFQTRSWYCIALNAKADLSDLPNFDILNIAVKATKQVGDHWELLLNKPLTKDLAAGTAIRQHSHGGYIYTAGGVQADANWKTLKGSIQGVAKIGWVDSKWPKGTAQAQIIVFMNYNGKNVKTEIKDVTLIAE